MLAKLDLSERSGRGAPAPTHVLHLWADTGSLPADLPPVLAVALARVLDRRGLKPHDLDKGASLTLDDGVLRMFVAVPVGRSAFERQSLLCKALAPLLAESPKLLVIELHGALAPRAELARVAVYCALVNGAPLPTRRSQKPARALGTIRLRGAPDAAGLAVAVATAQGNFLARELTALPPNELDPGSYRKRVEALAAAQGWGCKAYDTKALERLGAGAFLAVARGSPRKDAAILRLRYQPARSRRAAPEVALVGKGICFDTGGHNLKPARYMHGMHEDMNGSAVVLGLLSAATQLRLPLAITGWLALAQNHISPEAYKQNEVVRALDGTTIEVVHTDAEGRMVLADTLTLAAKEKPALLVDFATLTGSMITALGQRYAGVFANRPELAALAVEAGWRSGERVCSFPLDEDYDAALESKVADVKQCTLEGEADHILAARLLQRFVQGLPWLHVDLAAANCKGGLGAVGTDITGFGVGWGLGLLMDERLGAALAATPPA